MSLEDALNKNTAAVEAHNALLEKMLAAGGSKPAAGAAGKPAEKPATKPAEKPKTTTTKSKGEPTLELVTEKITAFLKTGDAETRALHKDQAALIMQHYDVSRFTQIPSEHWTDALGYLKDFEEGNTPGFIDENGGGDDGDGDDDGAMI